MAENMMKVSISVKDTDYVERIVQGLKELAEDEQTPDWVKWRISKMIWEDPES